MQNTARKTMTSLAIITIGAVATVATAIAVGAMWAALLAAPLATIMWLETKLRSNTTALEASREELAEVVRLDERTRPTILATVLDLDAFRANNPVEQAAVAEGHVAPVVHADFRRMPTYRQLRAHG